MSPGQARRESPIPLQAVGIVQPPYEYEDRLRPLPITRFKYLNVLVPEVHDLALMAGAPDETARARLPQVGPPGCAWQGWSGGQLTSNGELNFDKDDDVSLYLGA